MSIKRKCLEAIRKELRSKFGYITLHDDIDKPQSKKEPNKTILECDLARFELFYKYNAVKVIEHNGWYDVDFANGKWCYVYK